MCRFVAYVGPPVTLAGLLLDPPHALLHQSWAPRHQRHGTINADGFGAGWYDHSRRPEPARYRTARPMWADRSFASMAGLVSSTAVLGAVRDATPPAPIEESGTPPFTAGPWLFAHNGAVDGFAAGARTVLHRLVSDVRAAAIEGSADSEVLFALVLDRLDAGASSAEALADVVSAVTRVTSARLNLVLTDGRAVAATACGDSLFVLEAAGAAVVSSEPYDDDPAWRPVPDGSIVSADSGRVAVGALR
ncbi:MAG: ergothioneine biosynthesis protein EgtC [Actinomycetota bacterium]|nr:ergothioneine biosynthesis protein EgtC [Actinomycetota bacterium]